MNVLSLFDGMSCGRIALDQLGVNVTNYYACEIDKYAMKVSESNYPSILQLGNVEFVTKDTFGDNKIDLIIGGSPCQSFSKVGDGSGFDGSSALFWEYVRLVKELKPKYFMLENVVMKKEWEHVISEALGVEPIKICSSTFAAQKRNRLYWTNIPQNEIEEFHAPTMQDIIEPTFSAEYPNFLDNYWGNKTRKAKCKNFDQDAKAHCLTATMWKGQISSFITNNKGEVYKLTPNDCEALQTVPKDYTACVSNTQRYKMLGNGWTVAVVKHLLTNLNN